MANTLGFAIKVTQMTSAAGDNSSFVAILALKGMESEAWHVESVAGLSTSSHIEARGLIYFRKTRCGTKTIWKDYFRRVDIPTITQSNEEYNPRNPDGTPMRNFFSTDGEDIIIARAYESDVRQWLDEGITDYGRVRAGTTGIHYGCDRQHTFKSVKSKIKKVLSKQDCKNKNNRQLELTIRQAFAIYSEVEFGSTQQKCYTTGLLVLVYCFDKVMTRAMVINGFTCCGQDCTPDPDGCTVDFYNMMHQCYTDISEEQRNFMQEMTPGLSEIVKLRGTVTYQEMIDRGILPSVTSINRDDLSHICHWSEIVNHEVVVARYEEERRRNDPLRGPAGKPPGI